MNYVIFGGSFDPIHNGHVRILKKACETFNATPIVVLSKSPRWKNPSEDTSHRLNMVKIAIFKVFKDAIISDYEIDSKNEINYTIDTIKHFSEVYPSDKLYLLIGADQVNQFNKWKDAKLISNLAQIIYSDRPNYELSKANIKEYRMESLNYLESGDISSSGFRSLKELDIDDDVLRYIEKNRLYFVKDMLKYILPKRLDHSIEVAKLSYEVARVNHYPHPEKAYFAGMFHDIGKSFKYEGETAYSYMKEHYKEYLDLPAFSYHQFIGRDIAEKEFNIKDKEILDAIIFHCTGNENMTRLAKIIYACDKIEPTRAFDSSFLRGCCMQNDEYGFYETLVDNKKYLLAHNKDITNRLTDACFNQYLKELGEKYAKKR